MISDGLKAGFLFLGIVFLIMFAIAGFIEITYDDNYCVGTWKNTDFSDQNTCVIFYENKSGDLIMGETTYSFTWKPTFGRGYDIYFINGYKTDISISIYDTFFYTLSHDSYIEFYKSKSEKSS